MVKADLCDICLLEEKKLTLAKYRDGFKGFGKFKLSVCEKHKNWLSERGWKILKREKQSEFIDFILSIQIKVESILNEILTKKIQKGE